MALVALPTEIYLPNIATSGTSVSAGAGVRLNVATDSAAAIIQIGDRDDGKAVSKLAVLVSVVTASGPVDARVETVNATTGNPSGTLATTNANLSANVSSTGWNEFALTASHTVAAGDILAIVFAAGTGTDITVTSARRHGSGGMTGFPYVADQIDSVWTKNPMHIEKKLTQLAVGFSDGSWMNIFGILPATAFADSSIISSGAAEVGLEFQIPFAATLSGIALSIKRDFDIAVHVGSSSYLPGDTGATRLSTIALDKDIRNGTAHVYSRFRLSTPVDLSANTTYRVVIDSTTANTVKAKYMDFNAAANVECFGANTTWKHILDNTAGGWTTTTTRLPLMSLAISKVDDGAGGAGGGLLTHSGTTGGINA